MNAVTRFIPALFATVAVLIYSFGSFMPEDVEVFLFPRILSVLLIVMTVLLWIDLAGSRGQASESSGSRELGAIVPGLVIGVVYMLLLDKIGFYSASFLAFLCVSMFYDRDVESIIKSLPLKLLVSVIFMAVLFLLFNKGLHVRTPSGLLF